MSVPPFTQELDIRKMIDLTGRRFGMWTVIQRAVSPYGYEHLAFWHCVCDCGATADRRGSQLLYAERKGVFQSCQSCGAIRGGTTHGKSKTREYKVWAGMMDRCTNKDHVAYNKYGGRGIKVCDGWHEFENFLRDMGERPSGRLTLDRIDNDGPYCKENCRWADYKTQERNKSSNVVLSHAGRSMVISAWADELGVSHQVISQRLRRGWSVEDALTIPPGKAFNWRGTTHKDAATLTFDGRTQTYRQWADELGVSTATILSRLKRGWTVERALTTPKH